MMAQFLEFFGNHTLLFAALFGLVGALVWTFIGGRSSSTRISPVQATRLINDNDAVVVDVRPESEYREGHVVNAIHIPLSDFGSQLNKLIKYKNRPVVAICRAGQQSGEACNKLKKNGHETCYSVTGGVSAWRDAGLPLTKK
tara:strand:+ start:707 stop:1132 length:426 start_codon:yes stop_codon:yes gene_type:complete